MQDTVGAISNQERLLQGTMSARAKSVMVRFPVLGKEGIVLLLLHTKVVSSTMCAERRLK
jgi:hypothetical protein